MKDKAVNLTDEELNTAYELVSEFFGSLRADSVYYDLAQPSY